MEKGILEHELLFYGPKGLPGQQRERLNKAFLAGRYFKIKS
jgi:hypothetical protein